MIKLFRFLKPYMRFVIFAPLAMIVDVGCELYLPKIMSDIINIGVVRSDTGYIMKMGLMMFFLVVVEVSAGIGTSAAASIASQSAGRDIRFSLFEKIQTFSFTNIDNFKTSSLITRLTNDITQIQNSMFMMLRLMIRAPLLCVGGIFMAANINLSLTGMFFLAFPLIGCLVFFIFKKGFPLFRTVQEKLDVLNTVVRENLQGVRVVRAFGMKEHERKKFEAANMELKNIFVKAMKIMLFSMPAMFLVMNLATITVVYFGGVKVNSGAMKIGDVMAFITYLTQILFSFMMLAMVFMMFSRSKVSAERINEVLESSVDITDPKEPPEQKISAGRVEFKNVSFSYKGSTGDPVLEDISFTAEAGQTDGIIGATGAGKSTLVNLIPRLYDVTAGHVLIDGIDVRDIKLSDLRGYISVVLQETILFSGSITDNIKFGKENAGEQDVMIAAKAACAHDFIMNLPEKYDTLLGQKGVNLSGGQKQRISIARALIKEPLILILDDSTSSVDLVTESGIKKSLREYAGMCTKFIITQRISSISDADKILVINGGKIVAEGTHAELMKNSGEYNEIYHSQIREEVLADV